MERLAPREGEIILDLGSGPGRDVLYAGEKVGPSGLALGVDATPEMVFRSRETARSLGRANVEFRLGEIEHLPVETATVDGISSDCVVNLSPDKARVFREAFRVLKPGGRLVLSDVVAERDVAPEVRQDLDRWAACEAGAVTLSEYESLLRQAGFEDLRSEILGTYREGVLARAVVIGRKPKAA
jgi:ubiquinone/menaquinone biosynthesis C-methylase UbiE